MSSKQAERIIEKFGGVKALAQAIGRHKVTVQRWTYTRKNGGTDGYIPSSIMPEVRNAADLLGIEITAEDLAS